MKLRLLAFGITKEMIGVPSMELELPPASTVSDLLNILQENYPALKSIEACRVAVNNEFAQPETVLAPSDELALIPPVSGG